MNLRKINLKDAMALVGEANRTLWEKNKKKKPPRIDPSLTYKNKTLFKDQDDEETLKYYITHNDNRKKLRENNIVLGCWVVHYNNTVAVEDRELFFKKSIEFVKMRYGNIFNAFLHLDEPKAKPHLHIIFMPFEKGTHKFNAKKIMTPIECEKFHRDFSAFMSKELGYPVSMLNGETIKDENEKGFTGKDLKDKTKLIDNCKRLQKELKGTQEVIKETLTELKRTDPVSYKSFNSTMEKVIETKPNLFYRVKNWFKKLLRLPQVFHNHSHTRDERTL